jgi:hypothetical protein
MHTYVIQHLAHYIGLPLPPLDWDCFSLSLSLSFFNLPSSENLLIWPITLPSLFLLSLCSLALGLKGSGRVLTISRSVSLHRPIAAFEASASIAWARRAAWIARIVVEIRRRMNIPPSAGG